MNGIGERIRAARLQRGFTQEELASPEFTAAYVSQLERGRVSPSVRALRILAGKLEVEPGYLLDGSTTTRRPAHQRWKRAFLRGEAYRMRRDLELAAELLEQAEAEAAELGRPFLLQLTRLRRAAALTEADAQRASMLLTEALSFFDNHGEDRLAAEAALELGQLNERTGYPLLAVQYYRSALQRAVQGTGTSSIAVLCRAQLGVMYAKMGEVQPAAEFLEQAAAGAEAFLGPTAVAEYWLEQAEKCLETGLERTGDQLLQKAHSLYAGLAFLTKIGGQLRSIGLAFDELDHNDHPDPRQLLQLGLALENKIEHVVGQAETLLAMVEVGSQSTGEAEELLEEALQLAHRAGKRELVARVLFSWGQLLAANTSDTEGSREIIGKLELALDIMAPQAPSRLEARVHRALGEQLKHRGQTDRALYHFREAAEKLEELVNAPNQSEASGNHFLRTRPTR